MSAGMLCTKVQVVTVLVKIAWRSMSLLWDHERDPFPDQTLILGEINVARQRLVAAALVSIGLSGDPDDPRIADVPMINAEVIVRPGNQNPGLDGDE